MKHTIIDLSEKKSIIIPEYNYNYDFKKFIISKIHIFLGYSPTDKIKNIFEKITNKGFGNQHYKDFISTQEEKDLDNELSNSIGNNWKTIINFSSNNKLSNEPNEKFIFMHYDNIFNITKILDIQYLLEKYTQCPIELQFLFLNQNNLIESLISSFKYLNENLHIDQTYNLPFIDFYKTEELFQTNTKFVYEILNEKKSNIFNFWNYSSFFYNILIKFYEQDKNFIFTYYEYHIHFFLPLISKVMFDDIFTNKLDSSMMNYYMNILKEDNPLFKLLLDQNKIKEAISKIKTINFFNIVFNYDLLDFLPVLYKTFSMNLLNLFNSAQTTDEFPVINIKSDIEDKNIFKILIRKKIFIDKWFNRLNKANKDNIIFSSIYEKDFIKKINIFISKNSILNIYFSVEKQFNDISSLKNSFKIINEQIISLIRKKKDLIFPKFIHNIDDIVLDEKKISKIKLNVNTNIKMSEKKFNRLIDILLENCKFMMAPINRFESIIYFQPISMDYDFKSRIIIKNIKFLSIFFINISSIEVALFYVQLIILANSLVKEDSEEKKVLSKIGFNNIKNLKTNDPTRFDYDIEGIKPYAIIVQKNKQPIIVDEIPKNTPITQYIELQNLTFPEITNKFICLHPVYKYIGIVKPIKTKSGICVPSCFKINQLDKKSTRTMIESCKQNINLSFDEKIQSQKYVKKYETDILIKRYNYLPYKISLGINQDNLSTNFIGINSKIYLIEGIENPNLENIIISYIDSNFDFKLINLLKNNTMLFDNIDAYNNYKFLSIDNFINYITNKTFYKSYNIYKQILNILYPDYIFLFLIDKNGILLLDYISSITSKDNLMKVISNKKIIIIHIRNKIFSPIVLINKESSTYIFNENDNLVNYLFSIYQKINNQYVVLSSENEYINLMIDKLKNNDKFKITTKNKSIEVEFGKKKVSFDLLFSESLGKINDINDILDFIDELKKERIEIKIKMFYKNSKEFLTYLFLNIPISFKLKPIKISKELHLDYPIFLFETENKNDKLDPNFNVIFSDYKNFITKKEITELILNTIILILKHSKNKILREKIFKLIKKNDFNKIYEIKDLNKDDKNLIEILNYFPSNLLKLYFDNSTFSFDSELLNKFFQYSEKYDDKNIKKLSNIIDIILDNIVVKIPNKKFQLIEKDFIERELCLINNKNIISDYKKIFCKNEKIQIPEKYYNEIVDLIKISLINNIFLVKKIERLNINYFIKSDLYSKNDDEIILIVI